MQYAPTRVPAQTHKRINISTGRRPPTHKQFNGPQAPTPQRPIGANARTGVGAYRIRPPNIPQGMNDHTRIRVFATDGGARWGVFNTPLHASLTTPDGANARTRPNSPASADAPDAPRKVSKRAAERFRRVGKLKNAPLKVSEASEGVRDAGQVCRVPREYFAGGRSRPEGSEGAVRDAGQDCRVPGKLRRRPQPPRGVGRGVRDAGQACRVPGKLRRRPQPPRGVRKGPKSLLTFP